MPIENAYIQQSPYFDIKTTSSTRVLKRFDGIEAQVFMLIESGSETEALNSMNQHPDIRAKLQLSFTHDAIAVVRAADNSQLAKKILDHIQYAPDVINSTAYFGFDLGEYPGELFASFNL